MRIISLAEVEGFVKHTLKGKLQKDLRNLRILKEGDVKCCAYYHLRRILKRDPNWRVFARKFSQKTGYYTDLVIFHFKKARIAIEIKWGKRTFPRRTGKPWQVQGRISESRRRISTLLCQTLQVM